ADTPHLRATGGMVTAEIYSTPFFRSLRDLAHRLAIAQHAERPSSGDDAERDPVADEWLPAAEAAEMKGVALSGLHAAIQRGDVLARPTRPGGKWLLVSRRSLDRWTPNPARQSAGRARKQAAAG
ncbi:MAG: hypothetical protein NTZ05_01145, partial [Chloroflexi bacterium]|nr:hypothetical protein [Chloroflexota bacterium]